MFRTVSCKRSLVDDWYKPCYMLLSWLTTGALYDMIISCKSTISVSLTLIFCNLQRIVNINVHVDSKYLHVYKHVHFWRMHFHYVAEIKNVPKLFCQKELSENVIKGVNCQVSLIFSTCLNGTPLTPPPRPTPLEALYLTPIFIALFMCGCAGLVSGSCSITIEIILYFILYCNIFVFQC